MSKYLKQIKSFSRLLKTSCWTLSCGYCFLNFVAEPIICSGPSMVPTIDDRNIIIVEHISTYFLKRIKRGDIVVARSPTDPKILICKRVVGLEGDTIKQSLFSSLVVPRGNVWLHGDNQTNSTDSRQYGPVPLGLVIGRVIFRIWPPNNITFFTK